MLIPPGAFQLELQREPVRGYRFGAYEVDLRSGELRKHGIRLRLQDKPYLILIALLERAGQVVTREELHRRLWSGNTFVEFDHNLNNAVNRLREALSDEADTPRFIETLARRGYRFIAPVEILNGDLATVSKPASIPAAENPALPPAVLSRRFPAYVAIAGILTVLAMAGAAWWKRPRLEFHPRDWVLIVPFENRTGEAVFDRTIESGLQLALSDSRFINVIPPSRVEDTLALMRKPESTILTPALAREVALRDGGVRALLSGKIERVGAKYTIHVAISDLKTGATFGGFSGEFNKPEEALAMVRRLSHQVRERLGELLPQNAVPWDELEKVTTSSLRALQLYTYGMQFKRRSQIASARDLLQQAVDADPDFASARIELARAMANSDLPPEQYLPHAKRAFELSSKLGLREKYFIAGVYYRMTGEYQKAVIAYETLLGMYPDHDQANMNLASIYLWLGWAPSAIELNLRYAELRPNSFHIAVDTAHALTVWGGDIVRGRTYVDRARQLATNLTENPGPWASAFVDFFAAHEAWCRGDSAKAANEIERFAKMLPNPSGGRDSFYAIYAGLLYLALGKTQAAQEVFQKLRPEVERSTMLAVVALANDDSRLLRFHMAEFLRKNKSPYPNGLRIWLMIRAGMLEEAEQFVARRRSDHTSELYVPLLEGELHLARGQKAAAIERLEEAFRTTRQTGTPIFFLGAESLAKALDEGGRADEALHVLESASHQRVRAYVRPRPSGYFWLRIEVALAKLYRKLGKIEQAQTTENKLRRTLSEADMEHPILTKLP